LYTQLREHEIWTNNYVYLIILLLIILTFIFYKLEKRKNSLRFTIFNPEKESNLLILIFLIIFLIIYYFHNFHSSTIYFPTKSLIDKYFSIIQLLLGSIISILLGKFFGYIIKNRKIIFNKIKSVVETLEHIH